MTRGKFEPVRLTIFLFIYFTTQSSLSVSDPLLMSFSQLDYQGEVMSVAQSGANEIAKRCDVEISLVPMYAQRERDLLLAGKIDGVFARTAALEITVSGLTRVPEPTSSLPIYAYATRKNIVIDGWDSIKAYKVAYLTDDLYFESNFESTTDNTFSFSSIASALKFVDAGRADIFVHIPLGVESALQTDEFKNSTITALLPRIDFEHSYIHVLHKHTELAKCFDIALKNMKEDGTYQKIIDRLFFGS